MELWLDTCDPKQIEEANKLGIVFGITTNPTLLAQSRQPFETMLHAALDSQDGPVAVQVVASTAEEMVKQALALHAFSDRIIVKVPVIKEGLVAIKELKEAGVLVIATAVFHAHQALLAGLAGADYVAPYLARMLDVGIEGFNVVESIVNTFKRDDISTKVLVAAVKTNDHVVKCAEMGVHAITLKGPVFSRFVADDRYTLESVKAFAEDWQACEHRNHSCFSH